jgi:hypothetical protein
LVRTEVAVVGAVEPVAVGVAVGVVVGVEAVEPVGVVFEGESVHLGSFDLLLV